MEWLQSINRAIDYVEAHLTDDISAEDVAAHVHSSYSNFVRVFYLLTGVTIGEYIRNRRLSQAGRELLSADERVIDIALKYQYETPEGFSKAFSRFHGIAPSEVRKSGRVLKYFYPFSIDISVQGGYSRARGLMDEFHWRNDPAHAAGDRTDADRYQEVICWARQARGRNPSVFDELTAWMLDDSEWTDDRLPENRQILMQGIFARFREQNARLRTYLLELRPSGLVNESVFRALDRFDEELSGNTHETDLRESVKRLFSDFSAMKDREIRRRIACCKSGPTGTDTVDFYGYIHCLKDCDAQVQWLLFMPDTVRRQQDGFKVDSFEYVRAPAMRFIGKECDAPANPEKRGELFGKLDEMKQYASDVTADILFMHHDGLGVDVEPCHRLWGRFMRAGTPVPEGFQYYDLIPGFDGGIGAPYMSQYAYATFSGDMEAMHRETGFDVDAMYDVTRNIILGQGVMIPYPHKYWTAEVFLEGSDRPGTAYMFSVDLDAQ